MRALAALCAIGLAGGCALPPSPSVSAQPTPGQPAFTAEELEILRSVWIGSLPDLPPDPSNRVGDDPGAAALGEALFFDQRFSATGQVSCATCHQPELAFTDGLARGRGIGETPRSTMTVLGTAYSSWLFWDGRKDSQWAQALGPLENADEHGGNRAMYAHLIARLYREEYEALFGPLPPLEDGGRFPAMAGPVVDAAARANWNAMSTADQDAVTQVYVNIGKAIAAFERTLLPGPSRFDRFVGAMLSGDDGGGVLTDKEIAGLRLFIGTAGCTNCHNGPLFTNEGFHNTGVPPAPGSEPDLGRGPGIGLVQDDEFNCLSRWSDAEPDECTALRFLRDNTEAFAGAFKPPSLRNIAETGPYMDAGQMTSLLDVVRHYREAPAAAVGHSELIPPDLTDSQVDALVAFLGSLSDLPANP